MKTFLTLLFAAVSLALHAQVRSFDTSHLYFSPAGGSYTNYPWVTAQRAYTNSLNQGWMQTNLTTHRWEYYVGATLIATNSSATNIWTGTNGTFTATSYWASASSLTMNSPGIPGSGISYSTNAPATPTNNSSFTASSPGIRYGYTITTNVSSVLVTNTSVVISNSDSFLNGVYFATTNDPGLLTKLAGVYLPYYTNSTAPGSVIIPIHVAPFYSFALAPNKSSVSTMYSSQNVMTQPAYPTNLTWTSASYFTNKPVVSLGSGVFTNIVTTYTTNYLSGYTALTTNAPVTR